MINRPTFFKNIKNQGLFISLTQSQVDGINSILDAWDESKLIDKRWLAYMLATAYHETAKTMQAIEEYGKGKNRKYGRRVKISGIPYTESHIYYGRGFVQLTWWDNYSIMGRLLSIDLLNNPELALNNKVATQIMIEGMTTGLSLKGDFTGRSLEGYFNGKTEDPINARRIINGLDKAQTIASYYYKFKNSLL